jgi:hypothetical protein
MSAKDRRTALIWIYLGSNPTERLETIGSIDGLRLELIVVGNAEVQKAAELFAFSRPDISLKTVDSVSMETIWQAVPADADGLVYWMDDEKLVNREFPLEMVAPVRGEGPAPKHQLHYWDGHAIAVARPLAEALTIRDMNIRGGSLMPLLSEIIDRGTRLPGERLKLRFSPVERFAAIATEHLAARGRSGIFWVESFRS